MFDRKDLQLLPVLGNSPACKLDIFLGQHVGDVVVAERIILILFLNQLADPGFDRFGGHRIGTFARDGGREEKLQFINPLRGMGILIRCHPADR